MNNTNNGAAVATERKTREAKTERVKLNGAELLALTNAMVNDRDALNEQLEGLKADPKYKRFVPQVEASINILTNLLAKFGDAEYVAYAAPIAE